VLGCERDSPQHNRVGPVAQRSKFDPRYGDAWDLGHLGVRERSSDTASDTAAEGQPRIGLGAILDESLGSELMRSWVQILTQMHERDPGIHLHPGGELPARDRPGCGERALGGVDHRAQPQGLLDHCVEVGVIVSGFNLLAQASEDGRVSHQQLKRKGELRRGRLVPSAEHREQLVAQLRIGHLVALLIARAQQQRENVGALL
jgi:hypothetical protein